MLAVFQPAEETAPGAQAMIDDGLFERFPRPRGDPRPARDARPGRDIAYRPGTTQAAADSLEVRLYGRGAHGSMPESSIDPVVMAAATVLRLQTIVSREIAATQPAVVTVGALQAGTKDNVIPDDALISSTSAPSTRTCARACSPRSNGSSTPKPPRPARRAAGDHDHRALPAAVNDPARPPGWPQRCGPFRRRRVRELAARLRERGLRLVWTGWGVPSVFWYIGGTDRTLPSAQQAGRVAEDIPINHNARFAPVIHPTLETGVQAMSVAALDALDS